MNKKCGIFVVHSTFLLRTDMVAVNYILIAFSALGASFIQRVTGFGFGIFIMTVLPFLMPSYAEATALSGMMALISAFVTSVQMFRYLDWRKMWLILLVFLVVSLFSIRAVAALDSHLLRLVLGVVLILVSIYFFFVSGRIRLKPSVPVQIGMGAASGVMGGFFAMQGPPAVIYFLSCTDSKEQYMALISVYFVASNTMMTLFRAANGFVTSAVGMAWLIAVPAIAAGILLGSRVYRRIPIRLLRKIIYAYMALAGVIAIISFFSPPI